MQETHRHDFCHTWLDRQALSTVRGQPQGTAVPRAQPQTPPATPRPAIFGKVTLDTPTAGPTSERPALRITPAAHPHPAGGALTPQGLWYQRVSRGLPSWPRDLPGQWVKGWGWTPSAQIPHTALCHRRPLCRTSGHEGTALEEGSGLAFRSRLSHDLCMWPEAGAALL